MLNEELPNKVMRISQAFEKAVHMKGLDVQQLDALKISATTVLFLQRVEPANLRIIDDPHQNTTLQMYPSNKGDLVLRSSPEFDLVNDRTLDWYMLSEIKDFDQLVKGRQSYSKTTFEDLDDKLWHQISENELPILSDITTGIMQIMMPKRNFMSVMASSVYNQAMVLPFCSALAHRIITHRCDKFATNVTGMGFRDVLADITTVMSSYETVESKMSNFFHCTPPDEKRIRKTDEIAKKSTAFRLDNDIPAYPF